MTKRNLVIEEMKRCYQIKDKQTVLEHGLSVYSYFEQLKNNEVQNWKLPSWWEEYREYIFENILPINIIKEYLIMHDCGKPYCIHYDADG